MYYNLDMDVDAIVPLIPSPRGRVHCQKRTVENVIRGFESGPQSTERKARADKTPEADKRALIAIVTDEPQLFLSEIAEELRYKTGRDYNEGACYYELRKAGISLKKLRKKARQRDQAKRHAYWARVIELLANGGSREMLCFADETAKDTRALRRWRGWGWVGSPVETTELFYKGKLVSILAFYGFKGFIDYHHKEGAYSGDDFFEAAMGMILPYLGNYSRREPNSILVLDNCQIHKTRLAEFTALVESQGAKLVFLAPYCPIDNPIEKAFNVLKSFWRKHHAWLESAEAAQGLDAVIEYAINNCYRDPAASAQEAYSSCGYIY